MSLEPKRLDLSLYFSREPIILAVLTGLAAVAFLAVTGLARLYQAQQESLALEWSSRGVSDLDAGHYKMAIAELRTALQYSRDNDAYQLSLAESLLGLHRTDEARAYLINLWEKQPENAVVNLELARIAVGKGETVQVLRFYHNAIYATWPSNQETERRRARLELIDYLLRINARTQAESELIALEANQGDDAAHQEQLGDLFLRVQDNTRALASFRASLRLQRDNPAALKGAGLAAFNMGTYPVAERYLQEAVSAAPGDAASAALLKTTQSAIRLDPFRPQISASERNRIVVDAFNVAGDRLKSCGALSDTSPSAPGKPAAAGQETKPAVGPEAPATASTSSLGQQWTRLQPQITERGLRRDPDLVNTAMNLVFRAENQTTGNCGAVTVEDKGLRLIANLHEEN
jgi:tetratricopeptide (TPR) repeat protein